MEKGNPRLNRSGTSDGAKTVFRTSGPVSQPSNGETVYRNTSPSTGMAASDAITTSIRLLGK
jgi:hypothetical protein